MTSGRPVPGDRPQVGLDLRADHRVLRQRRVRQGLVQRRVVLEHDVQDRDQDEQQREQRGEGVVGDQRGQVPRLVVVELRPDRNGEGQHRPSLLERSAARTGRSAACPVRSIAFICRRLPGPRCRNSPTGQSRYKRESHQLRVGAQSGGRGQLRARGDDHSCRRKPPRCRRARTGRRRSAARAATAMSRRPGPGHVVSPCVAVRAAVKAERHPAADHVQLRRARWPRNRTPTSPPARLADRHRSACRPADVR